MTPFSEMLFAAADECGTDFRKLAEVLPQRVRQFVAEQDSPDTYDARRSVVEPFESEDLIPPKGFPIGLRADAVQWPAPSQQEI